MRLVCKKLKQSFAATRCRPERGAGQAMEAFTGTFWSPGDTLDYLAELAAKSDMWRGFEGQTHRWQCLCGSDTRLSKECTVRFVFVHVAGRPLSRMGDVGHHL